jgi:hypothetical protein
MGQKERTLGFDPSSIANRLGHLPDELTTHVDRTGVLPRGVRISGRHLKAYRLHRKPSSVSWNSSPS